MSTDRVGRTVYEAAGGDEGLRRLAAAWHARVMADEVVSHAFSHGYDPATPSGWPPTGRRRWAVPRACTPRPLGDETSVIRGSHSGNGPHEDMDRRAIACFDQALIDVGLARDDRLAPTRASRLFRVGHHYHHVPLPRLRRGRARWSSHPALVLGRAGQPGRRPRNLSTPVAALGRKTAREREEPTAPVTANRRRKDPDDAAGEPPGCPPGPPPTVNRPVNRFRAENPGAAP